MSLSFPPTASANEQERISDLEREVAELKSLMGELLGESGEGANDSSTSDSEASPTDASPSNRWRVPRLSMRGFGHVQYDVGGPGGTNNHFSLGGVDLFITSQLSESWSFLNETVFEFAEEGANILDVERVLLKWTYRDWLRISFGRGHTSLGYWNQRFHHGVYLETTAERPLLYAFEDDGGLLPIHFVGVELAGDIALESGLFSYSANFANGRGRITDSVQLVEDLNDEKAISLMTSFEPTWIDGLGFGVNGLVDWIPNDPDTPGRERQIREYITGAHLFYTRSPWEFILEAQWIGHKDGGEHKRRDSWGGYAQLAYETGHWKPYYRFDLLEIDSGDRFYTDLVEDTLQHTLGVRLDPLSWISLKLEYRHVDGKSSDSDAGSAQVSFAF